MSEQSDQTEQTLPDGVEGVIPDDQRPERVPGDENPEVGNGSFDAQVKQAGQDEAEDGSPNDRVDEVLGNVAPAGSEDAAQASDAAAGGDGAPDASAEPQGAPQPS